MLDFGCIKSENRTVYLPTNLRKSSEANLVPMLKPGQTVFVPCDVQPGAFPDEYLITINTDREVISEFVKQPYLVKPIKFGAGSVSGKVLAIRGNQIKVRLPGSFFTTASGLTSVSSDWATNNLHSTD